MYVSFEERTGENKTPRRRFVYFLPASAGLFLGVIASGILLFAFPILVHPATIIALLQSSALLALMLFGVTFFLTTAAAYVLRLPEYTEAGIRTALTAIWIAPLLLFAGRSPWLALFLWIALTIECTRLFAFVDELAAAAMVQNSNTVSGGASCHKPLSDNLSFALLPRGIQNLDSFVGAFCLEGAVCAFLALQMYVAQLFLLLATIALVRRGWRMLRESPPGKPVRLNRRVSVILAVATILIAFAWLPYTGGGLYSNFENLLGSMFGRAAQVVKADSVVQPHEHVMQLIFPGVILYPNKPQHVRLIVPRPSRGEGFSSGSKPLVIPFDGVYWMWRRLDNGLPKTAVLRFGSPEKLGFHSTDNSQLWMEAHQTLSRMVGLDCCREIDMVVENADEYPDTTAVEMVLRNTGLPGQPMQSLGLKRVPGRGSLPTAERTLAFKIPSEARVDSFNEITVLFRMKWTRGSKSAKVGIHQFVLIPR
jgi:hypothetical protein